MKTYHIKDLLKKEILIIELPKNNWLSVFPRLIWICNRETNEYHHIKGSYTLLGKRDEIKEEDAKELVEVKDIMEREIGKSILFYKDYKDESKYYFRAVLSLLSALESEIFWVNPVKLENIVLDDGTELNSKFKTKEYDAAELRTFDRSRSIILAKN